MKTALFVFPVRVRVGSTGLVTMSVIAACLEDAVEVALLHANSPHGFGSGRARRGPNPLNPDDDVCTVDADCPLDSPCFEAGPYHMVLGTHGTGGRR